MRVLVVVAHPDDEVLGCGGSIARHVDEGDEVRVLYVADGETARAMAAKPNRNLIASEVCKLLGVRKHHFLDLRDQRLDTYPLLDITQAIESWGQDWEPEFVYTHHAGDLNLDHAIVHRAVMTAFRPRTPLLLKGVYTFEVPSTTELGEPFCPNHFIELDITHYMKKMEALALYQDEMRTYPHPRSFGNINNLTAVRGAQVCLDRAEAFVTMRSIW